ncbi:hypothetical protein FV139_00585 [Parahaliea maris]|uniref:Uncharacterized protein n=1 Tax=Parahaliea maris TaxID=2716870 RepID=A0A5C9A5H7_9GAMM|nr:hypothetical protein [Parahaliea maris]TXS96038.1 hypothetical protein FV139_00585 [Parahaliea maris]
MPYDVEMPDGTIIEDVPDHITQAELLKRLNGAGTPPPTVKTQAQLDQEAYNAASPWEKLQLGVNQSLRELGHGLQELIPGLPDLTPQERQELARQQAVEGGWKTTGQIAGDAAMATAPVVGFSGKLSNLARGQRVAATLGLEGLGSGIVEGLQAPTDRLTTGAGAAATTMALGAVFPFLFAGRVTPDAAYLLDQGVKLTPGQAYTGGLLQGIEELASYIPGLAGGVRKGKDEALQSWNTMLRNGERPPQEAMKKIKEGLGKEYDRIFAGNWTIDTNELGRKWMGIQIPLRRELPDEEANRVFKTLGSYFDMINRPDVSGRAIQVVDRNIGKLANQAYKRGDGVTGEAYDAAQRLLRQQLPGEAGKQIVKHNRDYAAFKVLQDATAKVAPLKRVPPGTITPSELLASSAKSNRPAAAQGEALMQQEAQRGLNVLGDPASNRLQEFSTKFSPVLYPAAMPVRAVASPMANMLRSHGAEGLSAPLAAAAASGLPAATGSTYQRELEELLQSMGILR